MSQISIRGAKVHNLKNIDVDIPRNKLVAVTGLSGSGKSTLAFDTLFAEGQRRYVESLSAYARQFLGRINKPEVESITGIPPAIAIEQKVNTRNPRSTVGTSTEIYDYLKLLYARVGRTFSPVSGVEVKAHSVADVTQHVASQPDGKRMALLAPLHLPDGMGFIEKLTLLLHEGFSRVCIAPAKGNAWNITGIEEYLASLPKKSQRVETTSEVFIVVDRLSATSDENALSDAGDSVQAAFGEGNGNILVADYPITSAKNGRPQGACFSNRFEADGMAFELPSEHLFSFNNPLGACQRCEGYGRIIGIDEDLVIPDKSQSVYGGAVACWRGEQMSWFREQLIKQAAKLGFPIHKPYHELTSEQKHTLWHGKGSYGGLDAFFAELEANRYKIQYRVMLARYTGKTACPECHGARLRKEALYVQVGGKNISELALMSVDNLSLFMEALQLDRYEQQIAGRTLLEIKNRLQFLQNVGLGYLTLDRLSQTLSGGESQRINLVTSLSSNLVGSLYILDEPSIGLHPCDTERLVSVLKQLRDLGNTVVVVEHEEEIIRAADHIIDIGPMAGRHGGEIIFQGAPPARRISPKENSAIPPEALEKSLTLKYLSGKEKIEPPVRYRKMNRYVEVLGARENNLKNISVKFPLGGIVAVTGVSGSGKSSLVKGILYPALNKQINTYGDKPGLHDKLRGDVSRIKNVEMVDQNPIGRSSRSNPVTYIKAYDEIRKLYADLPYAKLNGYGASHFSFNIDGGRCEECQGDGFIKVEMQFMADVTLVCEACGGKRFKPDILEVKYHGYSISDVLDFTVNQAIEFFEAKKGSATKKIVERLKPLQNVGLGYIKLGQSSSTLSGGESQRVKLASFLTKEMRPEPLLFIFDEPTTGLHLHDIKKLLEAFNALVDRGHTVVVVEHNMNVVKCADWVIDLGPEGGEAGGYLCFCGTP
ncbi:MAG: excinuclease ABC subunit UvrA, partial [Prevotellaceae bacterium]|nr:excinuclease ABC subunit UvrA [Prevotellaceae bacterium]